MSKISVILPVYNGEQRVGRAIDSILSQTHRDLELIIVNDCSTDNTQHVLQEYAAKDSRIILLKNETNQKLPKTLNIGFARASGDYWTWTSDDNQYHSDALEKMCAVLDEQSEIDLVYADLTIVDMQGNVILESKNGEPEEFRFKNNIFACFLYRKSLALMSAPMTRLCSWRRTMNSSFDATSTVSFVTLPKICMTTADMKRVFLRCTGASKSAIRHFMLWIRTLIFSMASAIHRQSKTAFSGGCSNCWMIGMK